jgi:hypothetical protein
LYSENSSVTGEIMKPVIQTDGVEELGNSPFKVKTNAKATASVVWWSELLATDPEVGVRFQALPDFLRSSGSGTGSTQPREYN